MQFTTHLTNKIFLGPAEAFAFAGFGVKKDFYLLTRKVVLYCEIKLFVLFHYFN